MGDRFSVEALAPYVAQLSPVPQPEPTKADKHLYRRVGLPALIGSQAFDAITTVRALKQPGTRERNPLMPEHTAAMLGLKSAGTAGLALLLDKYAEHHPKGAMIAGLVGAILPTLAGVHNLKVARKQ